MMLARGRQRYPLSLLLSLICSFASAADPAKGNPDNGRAVYEDMDRGHCALCHRLSTLNIPFEGNIGPDLGNVGARLTPAQLRQRIMDPSLDNPNTIMPAYHKVEGLRQVQRQYLGQPILSIAEIRDLVAFLSQQQGLSAAAKSETP